MLKSSTRRSRRSRIGFFAMALALVLATMASTVALTTAPASASGGDRCERLAARMHRSERAAKRYAKHCGPAESAPAPAPAPAPTPDPDDDGGYGPVDPGNDCGSVPCSDPAPECAELDAQIDFEPDNGSADIEIEIEGRDLFDRKDVEIHSLDLRPLRDQIGHLVEGVPSSVRGDEDELEFEDDFDLRSGSISLSDFPHETVTTLSTEEGDIVIRICWETKQSSPIGLDIDGSGMVERITGEFAFDFDANGEAETVGEWFAPTEGIVVDTTVGGAISGAHLFGDQGGLFSDGFEKLAQLDANGDGQVSGAESAGLVIWTDANSNAVMDSGEVSTFASHNIVALSTSHTNFVSEATLADGSTMVAEDLWFPVMAPAGVLSQARVAVLTAAALGVAMVVATMVRRRKDAELGLGEDLDAELVELIAAEGARQPVG